MSSKITVFADSVKNYSCLQVSIHLNLVTMEFEFCWITLSVFSIQMLLQICV